MGNTQSKKQDTENQKQEAPKEVEAPKLIIATESAEIDISKYKDIENLIAGYDSEKPKR